MNQTFLIEFGVVIIAAAIIGAIAKYLKQPLILAYLVAGVLIGPFAFGLIKDTQIIETFAQIGIVFLLFLIGLELNPRKLIEIGNTALIAAFFQIVLSGASYFFAGRFFGFSSLQAIYIAVAFTFSSTAIIVTLLSNRNDLDSLHGKVLIGILLVQDFVALLLLTIMSGMNSSSHELLLYQFGYQIILRAVVLFGLTYLIAKFVLPPVFDRIARSQELLFISSIAWCFLLVSIAIVLGFSAEIGAFLAGISLAILPYSSHVAAKTKPLRDFFIMIFFIYLGTNLIFTDVAKNITPAIVYTLLILILNPIIVMLVMTFMGYRKRTSFVTGITLTQTSEFSFIVIAMAVKLNLVDQSAATLVSLVAIITVFISTYLITNANHLFHLLKGHLRFLNFGAKKEYLYNMREKLENHTILIGCHRMGSIILDDLKKHKEEVAIIDYDPRRVSELVAQGEICAFGDAGDHDIVEELNLSKAKMVISTTDKFEENELILKTYRQINNKLKFIMVAPDADTATELYKSGADLVIVPTLISGDYLTHLMDQIRSNSATLTQIKKRELASLES